MDDSRSNDEGKNLFILFHVKLKKRAFLDDSDPNPKRKKTDEVNETLVRIPLNRGYVGENFFEFSIGFFLDGNV